MQFSLSEKELAKFEEWKTQVIERAIEKQKQIASNDAFSFFVSNENENGYPYYGAIGGGFTFSFTPTSLGTIVVVKEAITQEQINLTDFDNW